MSNAIVGIISVVNVIIREVTIILITWIGYDTHSEKLTKITNAVFCGYFLNTAIVLLLVYADFGDESHYLKKFFNGPFNDYTDEWYAVVGSQIVSTMIINSILPPVFELIPIVKMWFFQRLD